MCAGGEGEGDACFTQPHHRPLANNCRLVVACLCWWLRGRRVSHSQAMLCCLLVPAWHVLLTPSPHHHHTSHGIVASLPLLSSLCDSTRHSSSSSSSSGGHTTGQASARDDEDDDTEVCATVCATRGVDAWRASRPQHMLQPGSNRGACVCVCVMPRTVWLYECSSPPPPPLISHIHPLGSSFFFCSHSHSSRLLALRVCALWPVLCGAVS